MNSFLLLQVSENVVRKSAEMAVKDPHGAIITLVSVSVVFVALILLYFAYSFIGKLSSGKISLKLPKKAKKKAASAGVPTGEEAAAIYDQWIDLGGKQQSLKPLEELWPCKVEKQK